MVKEEFIKELNEGQAKAFNKILDFLTDPECEKDAFVLSGSAGTGKTYLLKKLVHWVTQNHNKNRIAITAPTNKAVRVLYTAGEFEGTQVMNFKKDFFDESGYTATSLKYSTIHKLLGLTESITKRGEQVFKSSGNNRNEINNYNILIVDETSMLSDELCEEILNFSKQVKIIFTGDNAQIPPINKDDCIPFRDDHFYDFDYFELTEIMRQKEGNPIIEASCVIRENLTKAQPIPMLKTQLDENDHGIIFYEAREEKHKVREMFEEYFNCEAFKEDANYAKVIAWRNKIVAYMNNTIREILYGDSIPMFVEGEKLIADKPIFGEYGIVFNTSEEMSVIKVDTRRKTFYTGDYKLSAKIYDLEVESYDPGSKEIIKRNIEVIHEDSLAEYQLVIGKAKNAAKKAYDKRLWVTYYNIMKWSANVAYNYAITAHKSQGSTYQNVLLVENDIDKNSNIVERNRIKYTAYTRASEKLFILRTNY